MKRVFSAVWNWLTHHKVAAFWGSLGGIAAVISLIWVAVAGSEPTTVNNITNNNAQIVEGQQDALGFDSPQSTCTRGDTSELEHVVIFTKVSLTDACFRGDVTLQQTPTAVRVAIRYKNTTNTVQQQVALRVELPDELALVPNTTRFIASTTGNHWADTASNAVASDGLILGNFAPDATGFVKFVVATPRLEALQCGANTWNVRGIVTSKSSPQDFDDATVIAERPC